MNVTVAEHAGRS